MRVAVGGTFDILHAGHRALLQRAIDTRGKLLIGLTGDAMAGKTRKTVSPFSTRKRNLETYLRKKRVKGFDIVEISDELGPAIYEPLDAIATSAERAEVAERINQVRVSRGLPPLKILSVKMVRAEDSMPISSSRIRAKEVDRDGRMVRPLVIYVGTGNRLKVSAVKSVAQRIFKNHRVKGIKVESGVPPEPMEEEVAIGAMNRARRAIQLGDYGVGVEAGLFWNDAIGTYLDVQYCAVVDKAGFLSLGHGPGFAYPPSVVSLVRSGMTVGEAMEKITGLKGLGSKEGAIGYLSGGQLVRAEITEMAIYTAFLPRIRRDLYM